MGRQKQNSFTMKMVKERFIFRTLVAFGALCCLSLSRSHQAFGLDDLNTFASSTASASSLRVGLKDESRATIKEGRIQRRLLNDIECVLYLLDIQSTSIPMTGIIVNDPATRYGEEIWTCEVTGKSYSEHANIFVHDIIPGGNDKLEIEGDGMKKFIENHGAVSGKTSIIFSVAEMDGDKLLVSIDNVVEIKEIPEGDRRLKNNRRLSSSKLDTLVVRVSARDEQPPSADSLFDDIFDDQACLKSQFEACSYGQLTINEYQGDRGVETVRPGIIDVSINIDARGNNRNALRQEAKKKAEQMFDDDLNKIFDIVIFCMPPGSGDWLAYAYVNSWESYFNDIWCQSMSALMHEVGHNLGLQHAGTEYSKYGDISGMMGFSYNKDDGPLMCFNTPNNWQLGWFSSQEISIDPIFDLSSRTRTFTLNGIDDYTGDNSGDKYVAVRLIQSDSNGDFYIGFNKATGINSGTLMSENMLTITEKYGGPYDSDTSMLLAQLTEGRSYTLENFDGWDVDVEIKFISLSSDRTDAVIEVTNNIEKTNNDDDNDDENNDEKECKNKNKPELFKLELKTDQFPEDTSWTVKDSNGDIVGSSPEYSVNEKTTEVCVSTF